jgi:hypothetical protein
MNEIEFRAALASEGFDDVEVRTIAANVHNQAHSHPFDVRALLIAGELTLSANGKPTTYCAGEIFTLSAGCEHVEQFGPQGATYLVGRRRARA